MQIVIDIPEEIYKDIQSHDWKNGERWYSEEWKAIHNGKLLPKGHGRLIDESDLMPDSDYEDGIFYAISIEAINGAPTIIEADKQYEAEVITRGNCMMCGKELTEGLFFCKECEAKAESEVRNDKL